MNAQDNLNQFKELMDSFKSLTDEEVELFIQAAREQGVAGDEDRLRRTLNKIRSRKGNEQ